jgi:hypothetical protein
MFLVKKVKNSSKRLKSVQVTPHLKFGESFSRVPGIIIKLDIRDNNLSFEVMNYIKENADKVISEDGFSIKSIERWLDLQFGNNYSLEMKNEGSKNFIKLNIKLPG